MWIVFIISLVFLVAHRMIWESCELFQYVQSSEDLIYFESLFQISGDGHISAGHGFSPKKKNALLFFGVVALIESME